MAQPKPKRRYRYSSRQIQSPAFKRELSKHARHVGEVILAWNLQQARCFELFWTLSEAKNEKYSLLVANRIWAFVPT